MSVLEDKEPTQGKGASFVLPVRHATKLYEKYLRKISIAG